MKWFVKKLTRWARAGQDVKGLARRVDGRVQALAGVAGVTGSIDGFDILGVASLPLVLPQYSEDILFDHTPFSFWTIDGLDRTCYLELILDSWRCMAQIQAHIAMMYMLEDRRENH